MIKNTLTVLLGSLALLSAIGSSAHAAPVYERECVIQTDETPRSLFIRSSNGTFKAVFEMKAGDPQVSELSDVRNELSEDRKVETYQGRLESRAFGPKKSKVTITVDTNGRTAAGKSPAKIKYRKFIFGKTESAECSDWAAAPAAVF